VAQRQHPEPSGEARVPSEAGPPPSSLEEISKLQGSSRTKRALKTMVGRGTLTLANWAPQGRRLLGGLGLRTTQDLFGDRIVSIKLDGTGVLKLTNVDATYLAFQLFWHGVDFYEPITRLLLARLLQPGTTFLDIGAHLGFFTITSSLACPGIRTIAFEPNPKNFRALQANVAANALKDVVCEPLAISDLDGPATLYLTESDMSASLMKDFQAEDTRQVGQIQVQTTSLDNYVEPRGFTNPLVMKVDIEGHEPAFFRGAARTITRNKPDIILEVLYEQDPKLIAWLKSLGYRFYPITDQGLVEIEAPRLIKRFPFLFLNHLLSTRPPGQLQEIFEKIEPQVRALDLRQTSKHFPKEQWPLLWRTEN
jgi:FkbM family methyltransferase